MLEHDVKASMAAMSRRTAPDAVLDESPTPDVVVQPIVDLRRGVVVGYEALARFPGGGCPVRWFEAAERLGQGAEQEAKAIRAALARRASLPPNCFLTINVSPRHLPSAVVREVLDAAAPLHGVVIELTERHTVDDPNALTGVLGWLRNAGAHIALDDVGAGYAGLSWLLQFRPDFLKLDIEVVRDVDRDEAKRILAEMVGTLASRLDIWVLAEGVERMGELDALVALGVPLAQGFALGRPAPEFAPLPDYLTARLRSRPFPPERSTRVETIVERGLTLSATDTGRPRMRVRETDAIVEVAQRVLTRPAEQRWDPIECRDLAGSSIGIVRVERLLDTLTKSDERKAT